MKFEQNHMVRIRTIQNLVLDDQKKWLTIFDRKRKKKEKKKKKKERKGLTIFDKWLTPFWKIFL